MSRLYPGACCDDCGRADMLGKPRHCDGNACRVNQDGGTANAMRAMGACDNGLCGLPRNMVADFDVVAPMNLMAAQGSAGQWSGSTLLGLGCGGGCDVVRDAGRVAPAPRPVLAYEPKATGQYDVRDRAPDTRDVYGAVAREILYKLRIGCEAFVRMYDGDQARAEAFVKKALQDLPTRYRNPALGTPAYIAARMYVACGGKNVPANVMTGYKGAVFVAPVASTAAPLPVSTPTGYAVAASLKPTAGFDLSAPPFSMSKASDVLFAQAAPGSWSGAEILGVRHLPAGMVMSDGGVDLLTKSTGALYLSPPAVGRAPTAAEETAWLAQQPGETFDENVDRGTAYNDTKRAAGEAFDAWAARVQTYYAAASTNANQKAWIDAMRRQNYLPPAPGGSASGWTPAQISGTVNGIISGASSTILALVQGAQAADRQARADAAAAAAARLAAATTITDRIARGVEAAYNAQSGAQAAALLAASDRAGAVTRLSEAQGSMAVAQAARAVFSATGDRTVPPALDTAVRAAATAIADAVRAIQAVPAPNVAPIETPPSPTSVNNASTASSGFLANLTPTQKVVGGAAALVALFFGAKAVSR